MKPVPTFLRLIPAAAWMGAIFTASSDAGSAPRTSRFIGPLLHWLLPRATQPTIDLLHFCIRKTAHFSEYAILGILLWVAAGARKSPARQPKSGPDWPRLRLALLISAAYAATDEFHQLFVPSREALVGDALLDTAGAAAGLALIAVAQATRRAVALQKQRRSC